MGRQVKLPKSPQRIISLVPSQTELLWSLGLGNRVVGITKFCVHPKEWWRKKKRIGGTKNINPQRLLDLNPDLIIANKEENEPDLVAALENDIPIWVSDIHSLDEALAMIRAVGKIVGEESKADALADEIFARFEKMATIKPENQESILYLIWKDPYIAVGRETFIDDIMGRISIKNILSHKSRYPAISVDEILTLQPDRIWLSSEPYPFKPKHRDEIAALFPGAKVQLVDGELFSWYGPRLLESPQYFRQLIN